MRAVIEKPARQAGLILEPGLVEILIRDADGRNLPLLSHALRQVWQRREGRVLSVDGYRASGEIDGAVAQTAEEVFAELSEEGGRQARDILLRLVEPSRRRGSDLPARRSRVRRDRRCPRASGRPAGRCAPGHQRRGVVPAGARSRRAGVAAAAGVAGGRCRGSADHAPPERRRASPGMRWGGPTASSTGGLG